VTQRAIVLADCHGRPELISNVLVHSDYNHKSDRLIFCGDFLDIGNHPQLCWDLLRVNKAELLWGNHELAIVLGRQVTFQNDTSWEFRDELIKHASDFKIATLHDNVLITHAGLSTWYYNAKGDFGLDKIVEDLNSTNPLAFWNDASPVWFRPGSLYWPYPGVVQICGHTPPGYLERQIPDFNIVDPYNKEHFGPDRYRYATIQDDIVQVFDSANQNGGII
jgi:hypothetical protein